VIYTRKTLASMPGGELLTVIATDPESVVDFAEFSRRGGLELVTHRENDGDYIFLVRNASPARRHARDENAVW
jgi:tRNA 2-thiouridine synthesizing protein A